MRSEELKPQSCALKELSERILNAESRGCGVGLLVAYHSGYIDQLQTGLVGELGKRLRERLRRNVRTQRRSFSGLRYRRRNIHERNGRADRERTQRS